MNESIKDGEDVEDFDKLFFGVIGGKVTRYHHDSTAFESINSSPGASLEC